jgi:DNA primase
MTTGYIDYAELKRSTTIDRVAEIFGLKPKKNRSQCPVNRGDARELVISVEKSAFYCFGCKKGGGLIDLAAHIQQSTVKEAAHTIKSMVEGYQPQPERGLPADGFTDLLPLHPRVQALGLAPQRAAELAIGFRNRGTTKDAVCIPFRDTQGKLLGYILVDKDGKVRLPKQML